tara:strand:- start:1336 stop:1536 length:201 start_codon:yes stop_codon:yes gene_type:complete
MINGFSQTVEESSMNIPKETVLAIEQEIASDISPVGIDAKKTHIIIIHQLHKIEERLARIEESLGE